MPVRYLALGDSYTIGAGVEEAQRWPNQLAERLRSRGYEMEVTIVAQSGWTVQELLRGMREQALQPPYDLISLLIGANDQFRGYDPEQYRKHFARALGEVLEYAGSDAGRVIVVSIPDWGVTPAAGGLDRARIAREIDAFNSINREEALLVGAWYVDVTAISRQAEHDLSLLVLDGLHPSEKMYSLWVEIILPYAESALQERN